MYWFFFTFHSHCVWKYLEQGCEKNIQCQQSGRRCYCRHCHQHSEQISQNLVCSSTCHRCHYMWRFITVHRNTISFPKTLQDVQILHRVVGEKKFGHSSCQETRGLWQNVFPFVLRTVMGSSQCFKPTLIIGMESQCFFRIFSTIITRSLLLHIDNLLLEYHFHMAWSPTWQISDSIPLGIYEFPGCQCPYCTLWPC